MKKSDDRGARFTWEFGDVEFEKPEPGAKPLLTPEQRVIARRNLERIMGRDESIGRAGSDPGAGDDIPNSVRYVKNGPGGLWWQDAKAKGQIHAEWSMAITPELIENPGDFAEVERLSLEDQATNLKLRRMYLNQLLTLLKRPSQYVWITFEEGCLWWCTVADRATVDRDWKTDGLIHFHLTCGPGRGWSNYSLERRRLLSRVDLPGKV
ncbi:MAG TPA: hypothetical protein VME41_13495, partial [Stellaceae bacterium]|nr:hypothetical protein [Stellaceae bacterium]